jgi:hypothetical protein
MFRYNPARHYENQLHAISNGWMQWHTEGGIKTVSGATPHELASFLQSVFDAKILTYEQR